MRLTMLGVLVIVLGLTAPSQAGGNVDWSEYIEKQAPKSQTLTASKDKPAKATKRTARPAKTKAKKSKAKSRAKKARRK